MSDLLVKLYELPPWQPAVARCDAAGIRVHRARAPERNNVIAWVADHFGERWAGEAAMAFGEQPLRCFLALDGNRELLGFVTYDVTVRGFLGPLGVAESCRGKGIGTALLLRGLHAMHEAGYAYGVIGWSSQDGYYEKVVGATVIPDSEPGPYAGMTTEGDD